jgi:general secretion pathway protein A
MIPYRSYFGLTSEPFSNDLNSKNLMELPSMESVKSRMDYVLELGAILVVTGDVGSGKSTSLRWSTSHYHPSQVLVLNVIANSGSINEFYKQLCWSLKIEVKSASRSLLIKSFKEAILEISQSQKQKIMLLIDEANILRAEVFAELHTLTQFKNDSRNLLSIVLSGQSLLIDKLTYRTSLPLASRVIAKTHLSSINQDQMKDYLTHHLKIAGCRKNIFNDSAVTAIHQGSGGILRKANLLAKGGLIAAVNEKQNVVSAEHIRIASSELI